MKLQIGNLRGKKPVLEWIDVTKMNLSRENSGKRRNRNERGVAWEFRWRIRNISIYEHVIDTQTQIIAVSGVLQSPKF